MSASGFTVTLILRRANMRGELVEGGWTRCKSCFLALDDRGFKVISTSPSIDIGELRAPPPADDAVVVATGVDDDEEGPGGKEIGGAAPTLLESESNLARGVAMSASRIMFEAFLSPSLTCCRRNSVACLTASRPLR